MTINGKKFSIEWFIQHCSVHFDVKWTMNMCHFCIIIQNSTWYTGTHCFLITTKIFKVMFLILYFLMLFKNAPWQNGKQNCDHMVYPNNKHDRLTNIRYADIILLFGKSLEEVVSMVEFYQKRCVDLGLSYIHPKRKYYLLSTTMMHQYIIL